MPAFSHHIFVCGNARAEDHPRGSCDSSGRQELRDALKKAIRKAGFLAHVRVNQAGCLDQCEHGPVLVIYPHGIWYGRVTVEDVPRIVEKTLVGGETLSDLVIADSCLNNPDCPHRVDPSSSHASSNV